MTDQSNLRQWIAAHGRLAGSKVRHLLDVCHSEEKNNKVHLFWPSYLVEREV